MKNFLDEERLNIYREQWDSLLDKSGECWIYLGNINAETGYGRKQSGGKRYVAHRFAYQIAHNVVLERNQHVCHTCDNPPCCRPDHLYVGSPQTNADDRVSRGRHRTHVLSQRQIEQIIDLKKKGASVQDIASRFGVTFAAVRYHIRKQNYGNITDPCESTYRAANEARFDVRRG